MKLYRVRLYTEVEVVVLADGLGQARRLARESRDGKWMAGNPRQVWALKEVPRAQRDEDLGDGTTPRERLK